MDKPKVEKLLERVERAQAALNDALSDLREEMSSGEPASLKPADHPGWRDPRSNTPAYPATSASTAQRSWINLMGRRSRMELSEFYKIRTQLIGDAVMLSAPERRMLRGQLAQEVSRKMGGGPVPLAGLSVRESDQEVVELAARTDASFALTQEEARTFQDGQREEYPGYSGDMAT